MDVPRTKSAAHAFGFGPCPSCNAAGLPSKECPDVACAWCWDDSDKDHRRFVTRSRIEEWAAAHGMTEDDITTSPETRGALSHPPILADTERPPDTEPGSGDA